VARACLALVAVLALGSTVALAGTVKGAGDPGVTPTSILLGGTTSLTGSASPFSAIAVGADAYFKHVNAKGGVNGRSITYRYLDDASTAATALQRTRDLVEQEHVFAIFNTLGTEPNLAIRPYLSSGKVPQLFATSGDASFGRDYARYPTAIGFQPTYAAEGWVVGKYLARSAPGAKVAVLFQDDAYGKDLFNGLRKGLERSKTRVIAAQPSEATPADLGAQIARLKASGADTLAIFATPKLTIQAFLLADKLGWKPRRAITSAASSASSVMQQASQSGTNRLVEGAISIAFLKDPTDPEWKSEPSMKLYGQIMEKYAPDADATDVFHVYGMAVAWTAVEALKKAGKDLTRASLVKALDNLNAPGNPFLLPGIAVKTSGVDHYPIEQMLLQRWQKGAWKSFGGLWGYRAP
jgi:branched-chain amino acid transport system substrate-binding protein